MKLKLDPKNPRRVLDEMGNEVFIFTGFYLDDLWKIIESINDTRNTVSEAYDRGYFDGSYDRRNSF